MRRGAIENFGFAKPVGAVVYSASFSKEAILATRE